MRPTRNGAPLSIIEIAERSTDGRTFPFKCRCDDENLYYVKGKSANHRSLICEWMAGNLAAAFGLNLPRCAIASAPASLVRLHPEGKDLGTGPVFASRAVENLNWISYASRGRVPISIRRDILVFDWWVHNADRTLSETGGNPNLLFDASTDSLVVIDHNLAFDSEFDERLFLETHVFGDEWEPLCQDLVEMANYQTKLKQALDTAWDPAWKRLPEEWLFHDDEQTVLVEFDERDCKELLERCTHQDFWRLA
ncbi:HipA family kinase [Stenotrophomonas rhizophila]|uniref:HipA family kinase n=1 Tax=Stenotrophomonas rhizophila TaxID=216778 RepID=UPI003515949E